MSKYALKYMGGRAIEIVADNDDEAEDDVMERFGAEAVTADQWDVTGYDAAGGERARLLIWASEADAADDTGGNAIAQLTRVP